MMLAIRRMPDLELQLIVTGMHLVPEFGFTVDEIEHDGFDIDMRVEMMVANDTSSAMAKSVGLGVIGITQAFEQLRPDILLVLGDRVEPLAAAIAASIMNIPIAHSGGGQCSGSVDNSIRHAITKFAHIHFARTPLNAERLRQIGEEAWRIHIVGNICFDTILHSKLIAPRDIAEKYSLNTSKPILLAIFHPDTLAVDESVTEAVALCHAIVTLNEQTIFIYPNADAGGRRILKVIQEHARHPKIHLYTSIPQIDYYSIMNIASLMLGNSSSGLIEAPAFGLPVINIGNRQLGRDRFSNVVDVAGEETQIVATAKRILTDHEYRRKLTDSQSISGDGKTGERIARILSDIEISDRLLHKSLQCAMVACWADSQQGSSSAR